MLQSLPLSGRKTFWQNAFQLYSTFRVGLVLIFDCSTEVKVTTGHPAQGARFHLQSVRSIPGIKEWRERERERESVCVCVTERDCDAPTYRWGAGNKGENYTDRHFFNFKD